jgi:hypothetical protein
MRPGSRVSVSTPPAPEPIERPAGATVNDDELFDGEVAIWRRALAAESKALRTIRRYADDIRQLDRYLRARGFVPRIEGTHRAHVQDWVTWLLAQWSPVTAESERPELWLGLKGTMTPSGIRQVQASRAADGIRRRHPPASGAPCVYRSLVASRRFGARSDDARRLEESDHVGPIWRLGCGRARDAHQRGHGLVDRS